MLQLLNPKMRFILPSRINILMKTNKLVFRKKTKLCCLAQKLLKKGAAKNLLAIAKTKQLI